MSGGGSQGSTTTQAQPWSGIQPSLSALYGNLAGAYSAGQLSPNQNTGQVAPWSGPMSGAFNTATNTNNTATNLATNLATGNFAGSGNVGAQALNNFATGNFSSNPGTSTLANFASGAMTNPNNPSVQALFNAQAQPVTQQFTQAVLPGILSTFAGNGRLGSNANMNSIGLATNSLGTTLNNLAGQTVGQNYEQQVQNQLSAANSLGMLGGQAATSLSNLQGSALSALPGMGSSNLNTANVYQSYLQNILNSQINQSNYNANQPLIGLQNLSGLLQNGMALTGSSGTSQQQQQANPFGTALGGAATGAAIGSAIPGVGTAIGAGVGGLAGLLGGYL